MKRPKHLRKGDAATRRYMAYLRSKKGGSKFSEMMKERRAKWEEMMKDSRARREEKRKNKKIFFLNKDDEKIYEHLKGRGISDLVNKTFTRLNNVRNDIFNRALDAYLQQPEEPQEPQEPETEPEQPQEPEPVWDIPDPENTTQPTAQDLDNELGMLMKGGKKIGDCILKHIGKVPMRKDAYIDLPRPVIDILPVRRTKR